MAALERIRAAWSGFAGGPGVSTFYVGNASAMIAPIRQFFFSNSDLMPVDVHIQVESTGDVIESTTGLLTGSWSGTPVAVVDGTGTGAYAAPVGATVRWETGNVVNGHRVRGRTYMVPLLTTVFQAGGALTVAAMNQLRVNGQALIDGSPSQLTVFTRPRVAVPSWTDKHGKVHPAITAQPGGLSVVATAFIPPKAAVLTTRRD